MKKLKYKNKLLACLMLLTTICNAEEFRFKATQTKYHESLSQYFSKYTVYEIPLTDISNYVMQSANNINFNLSIGNEIFALSLELNDMRGKDFKAVALTELGEVELQQEIANTYKGTVDKDEGNVTRLTIDNSTFEGYINKNGKGYFIDKLTRYNPNANASYVIVYEAGDVKNDPNHVCGVSELNNEKNKLDNEEPSAENKLAGVCRFVEIATEADYEYYQDFGSNANLALNRIRTILNLVEGMYTGAFKVKFVLRYQQIWTTAGDPYSGDTLQGILPQFTNWWNANRTNINRDLTHMFTGRSLSNSAVGYAWIGVMCNTNWYYGCVANYSPVTTSTINLSTHEIGHNFGAYDDYVCNPNHIMCGYLSSSVVGWNSPSTTAINNHINSTSCMDYSYGTSEVIYGLAANYNYVFAVATNSITINSAANPVQIGTTGFVHLESGNQIILAPTNANTTGFIANEGSTVLLRISDLSSTCLVSAKEASVNGNIDLDPIIFPNPASDFISVALSSDAPFTFKIYNSTMQLIKTLNFESGIENTISTADLPPGIYFIDAQSDNQHWRQKFIINR
nr:T9SS type A sorting domain-containing protein [Bacteroidota bacterium]